MGQLNCCGRKEKIDPNFNPDELNDYDGGGSDIYSGASEVPNAHGSSLEAGGLIGQ